MIRFASLDVLSPQAATSAAFLKALAWSGDGEFPEWVPGPTKTLFYLGLRRRRPGREMSSTHKIPLTQNWTKGSLALERDPISAWHGGRRDRAYSALSLPLLHGGPGDRIYRLKVKISGFSSSC